LEIKKKGDCKIGVLGTNTDRSFFKKVEIFDSLVLIKMKLIEIESKNEFG